MLSEFDKKILELRENGYVQLLCNGAVVDVDKKDFERITAELENTSSKWLTVSAIDGNEIFLRKDEVECVTSVCAEFAKDMNRKREEEAFKGSD